MSENVENVEQPELDEYAFVEEEVDSLGLKEESLGSTIFLQVKHDGICEEYKKEQLDREFVHTPVTNPRTDEIISKWVKHYGSVEGFIDEIEYSLRDQNPEYTFEDWKIHINTLERKMILALKVESRVGERFMKMARNIDYKKPVEFMAWKGDSFSLALNQNGENVPEHWNKDTEELPRWVESKDRKGKITYDKSEYLDFLVSDMKKNVMPYVKNVGELRNQSPTIIKLTSERSKAFQESEKIRIRMLREERPEFSSHVPEDVDTFNSDQLNTPKVSGEEELWETGDEPKNVIAVVRAKREEAAATVQPPPAPAAPLQSTRASALVSNEAAPLTPPPMPPPTGAMVDEPVKQPVAEELPPMGKSPNDEDIPF